MKWGYFTDGDSIPSIDSFTDGANILVVCSPTEYISKAIALEDLGWEVRDCIKSLLRNKTLQIGLFRKRFKGTVANNVLTNGCGGLNIDATRIKGGGTHENHKGSTYSNRNKTGLSKSHIAGSKNRTVDENNAIMREAQLKSIEKMNTDGRFPANLILNCICEKGIHNDSNCPCLKIDLVSGIKKGNGKVVRTVKKRTGFKISGSSNNEQAADAPDQYGDSGGASRFFYNFKSELEMKSYLIKLVMV